MFNLYLIARRGGCFWFCGLLAACEEEQKIVEAPIRAIKTIVIKERAGDQVRRIAGLTESSIVTDLAFQVGGRIVTLGTDVAIRSKRNGYRHIGFRAVQAAYPDSRRQGRRCPQQTPDTEAKFKQQSTLYKQGFATKTAFDSALSKFNSAKSNVDVAKAEAELAERDMRQTTLTSPLHGNVTEKYVEQFAEVSTGQKIVQRVSADGGLKIKATVPEGLVRRLSVGDPVQVSFRHYKAGLMMGKSLRLEPGPVPQIPFR